MLTGIIESTILASALAITQPQMLGTYCRTGIEITSNCPAFDEVEKRLPNYGIENLVAQAPSYQFSLKKELFTISWHFFILAYSLTSEHKQILILKDDKEVNQLAQMDDIKVIEIYEVGESGKPLRNPSAFIYKGVKVGNEETNYIKLNLTQDDGAFCNKDKDLVNNITRRIAAKRLADMLDKEKEEKGIIPSIPERVEKEI